MTIGRPVRSAASAVSPAAVRSTSPSSGTGACSWKRPPGSGQSRIWFRSAPKRCHASRLRPSSATSATIARTPSVSPGKSTPSAWRTKLRPAIGADEEARADNFTSDLSAHPFAVLSEAGQLAPEFRRLPKFGQTLAHDAFGHGLRRHQRAPIGLGRRRALIVADRLVDETAIRAVHPDRRIRPARREQAVDDPVILEHLLRARLDALAARAAERRFRLLDQAEIDAAPGKIDRQRKPRRAGAADQDVGRCFLHHDARLRICV